MFDPNPNFRTDFDSTKLSPNRNEGNGQDVPHGRTDDPLNGPDPMVVVNGLGIQSPYYNPQISALTETNSSRRSLHLVSNDNEESIEQRDKQQPSRPTVFSHSPPLETPEGLQTQVLQTQVLQTQVPPSLSSSFGFVNDHVGVTWRDVKLEHDSIFHTEPYQAENSKSKYTFPPPPHSPANSFIEGCNDNTSFSGGNLGRPVLTHNVVPKSMIERRIQPETVEELPRLVHRNRAFHQSANKVYVKHNQGTRIYKLLRFNWFHVFLRWPTKWSLLTLVSIWTSLILIFAAVYTGYDNIQPKQACGLGPAGSPITFAGAFAFSLETCTTVGYTLPFSVNSFFEPECGGLQVIIYFQMIWSMIFNAFLLAFLYNRVGRSENRSTQVIYSNKALVSIVDGQVRFQIRLFDCDAQHPVVEAHVRFYCVMKHRPVPRPMRLLQPNDELGGTLFLSFPTVVCHSIDLYSLLHPPEATMLVKPHGLGLRQVDGGVQNRDDVVCPVCGESYGTFERWWNHVRFQQIVETKENYPVEGTHRSLDLSELRGLPGTHPTKDMKQLEDYFKGNVSEILCLVEGIDPMQSGTFQALQSYRYDDIVWEANSQFSPCLFLETDRSSKASGSKIFSVDLDRYHDIIPDPVATTDSTISTKEVGASAREVYKVTQPATNTIKMRHHNVKTLSNRTSDSLFAPETSRSSRRHEDKLKVLAERGVEPV
jgi:hypothetical protein